MKRDGSVIRSKAQIIRDYDESSMPYPLKNLLKLDYCWKLNYTMFIHSFYLSTPLSGIYFIYTNMPQCWNYTLRTFPYKLLLKNYGMFMLIINCANIGFSLMFEDYCKRDSEVYSVRQRNAHALRALIRDTNT